jgi:predicted AAA+ superfamily ATPase
MFRYAESALQNWMQKKDKSPLLIRGARQVGKTYLVETVAKAHFDQVVVINFEFMPEYGACFSTLDPHEILKRLSLLSGNSIQPDSTLLFLDEIQQCPDAILALRYFKEKLPGLSVIAAGSLLEFVLNDQNFRMPVGRVEFMYLYPLSFKEFLLALGESALVSWIETVHLKDIQEPLYLTLHEKCLKRVREYCLIGGMPEVVKTYAQNPTNFQEVFNQQSKLVQGYILDFGKYAKSNVQHRNLQQIFGKLPHYVTQQLKYSHLHSELSSRDIKFSLEMLRLAGLCHFVWGTSGAGIPLEALVNEKKLKLIYGDVGLYLRGLYFDPGNMLFEDLSMTNEGSIAEQYVAQELLTQTPYFEKGQLYFWARDKSGSQAEVDYLWQWRNQIIPIEVKSGSSGWLKSLNQFRETYQTPCGIRISSRPLEFSEDARLWSIPFYLVSEMSRLLSES